MLIANYANIQNEGNEFPLHNVNRYPVRPPLRVAATQSDTYMCEGFKETAVM